MVVASVRDAWRPVLVAALAAGLRAGLARRLPITVLPRLRRARDRWRQRSPALPVDATVFYGLLTIAGVWLSMGPPLGLWPLVYWLPGLSFIRVPSRFMLLAELGLAVLAAIGFDRLARTALPRTRVRLTALVGVVMMGEFAAMPLPVTPFAVSIPSVDRWLASRPTPFAIAEFPTTSVVRTQTTYMLHSMAHWQKTVHGFSGFEPPMHTRLYQELRGFPDDLSLRRLRDLGVTYAVVHEDLYRPDEWIAVRSRLDEFADRMTLEHADGAGRVYSLGTSAGSSGPR
jgi:hypothetical protein